MKKGNRNRQSTYTVEGKTTLLEFLLVTIKDKSRNKVKSMLGHRQVKVGDEVTTQFNAELKEGDKVIISWDKGFKKSILHGLKIVFEDDDVLVVNKRSGLLSVGSAKEKRQTAYRILTNHIQQDNPANHLFVIHRLDRDASGLMVFAKNRRAQLELQTTWGKTMAGRKYLIVAEGTIEEDNATLDTFLTESKALKVYSTPQKTQNGKKAISHYEVIKKNEFFTLLEATQETERKHQLRAQFTELGHPVTGDKKYEAKENPLGRMAYHAKTIAFIHPTTHKEMNFETKVPDDFLKLFRYRYYE